MRDVKIDMASVYSLPNPNLRNYLARQREGSGAVITTNFAATDSDFWQSLAEWEGFLSSKLKEWPSLQEFEFTMARKVGPLSVMKPLRERLPKIEEYYTDVQLASEPVSDQAILLTARELGRGGNAQMLSVEGSLAQMKLSTNSGSPYFTKRKIVIERGHIGRVTREGNQWFTTTANGKFQLAATLGWRGQEGGPTVEDVKQRVLWMFPMDANVEEARVYAPLIAHCQQNGTIPGWLGNDYVDRQVTRLFDSKGSSDLIVGTDFTGFDQHFGAYPAEAALKVYRMMFAKDSNFARWAEEIFPLKYHIPLVIGWGSMLMGFHGMASGSGGTNADETVGHRAFQYEAALTAGEILNQYSMCLGDDGILSYPGITVEHVVDTYTAHGQVMNLDKQHVSADDVEYLKRWHHKNYRIDNVCRGVYSTCRALGKLRYMERFVDPSDWGATGQAIRALSILENCCYHPLREEFLDFCLKRDAFRLGMDIPGFLDRINVYASKAIATGVVGYQYTDSFVDRPASEWWVTKALIRRKEV
jgi:hypothetical protein